ncbi:nodulation protein NfeD [Dasania sp. GY-MA-18]|uniref:Nodulation protein NfeD n=1 Tax=Dasania phycosphaerae TaxID=2950436 RepID=A0A9J6RIT3_9GAMM|nr:MULTISPECIES: nodulation protein NfeD [Dasania]MCR8921912.1 nodulation protein NfeD [Dasania sp. GY-MA-18]MCZ0864340.1 nodulation protein NfeD [Dasania phycosphaerae]MCZ0868068.1 nodulation protein NfeD [Dasania phycosphaerae]
MSKLSKIFCLILLLALNSGAAASSVWLLDLRGAVGPASADYLIRGIKQAEQAKADLLILRIDTPGGLDSAMRDIIKSIIASPVPVASYVAPSGSRAASAGTYILYASHIAAMAPATNLGAATPVQIASPSLPSAPKPDAEKAKPDSDNPAKPANAMEQKLINDAVAYIEGLADLHGRNKAWAVKAVRAGASLAAEAALEQQVIDIIASDVDDLLRQLQGRQVTAAGRSLTLALGDAAVHHHQPDWRNKFLIVITDPNIAYILMMVGIYGLILEAYNPGTLFPGIIGGVCLLLALYAFQVLPISYAGLALIALGVMLMVAEAFAPSFGILGLGGVTAFIIGSIILMDTTIPAYQIALPVILSFATASAAVLVFVLGMIVRARKQQLVSGISPMQGLTTQVVAMHKGKAMVQLQGEQWQVSCQSELQPGDRVRVIKAEGVILQVDKL